VGNRLTTLIENLMMGTSFSELHSGYKAYSRRFLEAMPYHELSDQFVFDSQMVILTVFSREFVIHEVAIPTRYAEDSSSVDIPRSMRYVAETVLFLLRASFGRRKIRQRIAERLAESPSAYSGLAASSVGHMVTHEAIEVQEDGKGAATAHLAAGSTSRPDSL
jgi:hypothetical protein